MTFNNSENAIASVSMSTRRPVGDYILAWGPPDGMEHWGTGSYTLWWKTFSVYVTSIAQPSKLTLFAVMRKRPENLAPWHGFTLRDS